MPLLIECLQKKTDILKKVIEDKFKTKSRVELAKKYY